MKRVGIALAASLLTLVGAGCSSSSEAPTPPNAAACADGLRNQDESDVDCGGSCRAGCAVAASCSVDADCMLGACSNRSCVVPAGAPTPTGPVSVVLGAAGGTLDVVTPEGATLHLEVPAGALIADVPLTVEPLAAQRGEWFRIAFDTPGLLFRQPVAVTLTIPGGAFDAEATLFSRAAGADQRFYAPSARSPDGRTLTAAVTSLGFGSLAAPGQPPPTARTPLARAALDLTGPVATSPGADPVYWNRFFLNAASIPLDDLLPALRTLFSGLLEEGLVQEAMVLSIGTNMLLQRLDADQGQWTGAARGFFDDMMRSICTGLEGAMKRSAELQPQCFWQARDSLKDLLTLGKLENQVDAIASGGCNANNAWAATASALIDRTADYLKDSGNRLSIVACNCKDPKRLAAEAAGRLKPRPWCRAQPPLARNALGAASSVVFDRTTEPGEWEVLLESVSDSGDAFAPLYAVGAVEEAQRWDQAAGGVLIGSARKHAYALCTDNQDSSILTSLGRRVRTLDAPRSELGGAILRDAQRCGAALHVVAERAGNSPIATVDVPYPTSPDQAPAVPTVEADPDGWLQISGPLATLRCRDEATFGAASLEQDELTFTAVAGAVRVLLGARYANGAQDVLTAAAAPFPVDLRSTLVALRLPADGSVPFDVVIERKGPGCGVQPAPSAIFTVPVKFSVPRLILDATFTYPNVYRVFKIEPSGPPTEVFGITSPTGFGGPPFYLRQRQVVVGTASLDGSTSGWATVDARGTLGPFHPAAEVGSDINRPLAVSGNGRFRAHETALSTCPGGEGACTTTRFIRIYDNANDALLDGFPVDTFGAGGLSVGPSGEVFTQGTAAGSAAPWYLRPLGGPARLLGNYLSGTSAFGVKGDKVYIGAPPSFIEVDVATGESRALPGFTTSTERGAWTVEAGGILFHAYGEAEPRQLHRLDLTTGEVTDVGALPAWGGWYQVLVP